MAKKKKVSQENELDQRIAASVSFMEKYQKQILYVGGGVLAVVIAVLLFHQFVWTPRNEAAREALFPAQELFEQGSYEAALNGNEQAVGLLEVASKYGRTKSGNLAHLYAGLCYANLGKTEEAITELEKFGDAGDQMISPAALAALGNCYAQQGETEKAAKTLEKAAKRADNNTLSPTFLIQAAQLYESLEKNDKALDCYKTVKAKYQQSVESTNIDKYIERLK